jgi:molecular chaperone DnaK (HSP70)
MLIWHPQCFNQRQNNKITITNGKGKLNKDEIKNMIQDHSRCKKYKGGYEENKNKIDSKNSLENYVRNYEKLHYE